MSGSPGLPLGRSRRMVNLIALAGSYSTKSVIRLPETLNSARHLLARQRLRALDRLVDVALAENDVEGDLVGAGVLRADRLGEIGEFLRGHHAFSITCAPTTFR
jgi:hypothetical protein